jgi:hypothetical protein
MLKHHPSDSLVGQGIQFPLTFGLKDHGSFGNQFQEFRAGCLTAKVAAILFNVEWEGTLQIRAKRKTGVRDNAVPAFCKWRENAKKRRLG